MDVPPATHKQEIFLFNESDREWVRRKWELIRAYHTTADKCSNRWRKLSDEINNYLDRSGITDPKARAALKGENLELADLFANQGWFRKEAQAHTTDLMLFLRLKEVGLL